KEGIIDLKNEIAVRDEQVLKTNNRAKTMESDFIESEKQLEIQLANANKKNELRSTLNVKDNIIKSMKLGDHKIEAESERNKFTNRIAQLNSDFNEMRKKITQKDRQIEILQEEAEKTK
ncbi:hypothetical protein HHI36_017193, partial [Cryptolaemus montrouzieri]